MRLLLVAIAALGALGCATSSVTLDGYGGAYSTHFAGIPDASAVCARVTNRSDTRVEWVRLRLHSTSTLGERPARLRSRWIYTGAIEAGQSIDLGFVDPPSAEQIRIELAGHGRGTAPRGGRGLVRVASCSQAELALTLARPERDAALAVQPMAQPSRRQPDVLLAGTR
jgi:hypothetical protein